MNSNAGSVGGHDDSFKAKEPNSRHGFIRTYTYHLLDLFKQVHRILIIVIALGVFAVICGMIAALRGPLPGPENNMVFPVRDIAPTFSMGPGKLFSAILFHNVSLESIILATSVLHFGLAAFFSYFLSFLYLGATIGWFGMVSGVTITDGLKAYMAHAIPEFLAMSFVTSLSLWIGWALLKPDKGSSRFHSIKLRYRQALPAVPLIIALFVLAAAIESYISNPLAKSYAQKAVISETKKTEGLQNQWVIQVPASWKKEEGELDGRSGKVPKTVLYSPTIPVAVDVTIMEKKGAVSAEEPGEMTKQLARAVIENMGLKITDDVKEVTLAGHTAYLIRGIGNDPTMGMHNYAEDLYFVPFDDPITQTYTVYVLKVMVEPEYSTFLAPLSANIVDSFAIEEKATQESFR